MLVCAPILLPYIAGTRRTSWEGFKATLIFGLTRMFIYGLLGGLMGYVGYHLFRFFFHNRVFLTYLWISAGAFIMLLGVLIMLGKGIKNPICQYLQKQTVENSSRSMVILGIVVGLSPCLPLLGILTEIMFLSKTFYEGFVMGLAFGVGTVISPLLLLGALTPVIPSKLFRSDRAFRVFNFLCGFLLVVVGFYIIWKRVG